MPSVLCQYAQLLPYGTQCYKTKTMASNFVVSERAHAQIIKYASIKISLNVPHGANNTNNFLYINKLLLGMNRLERMKRSVTYGLWFSPQLRTCTQKITEPKSRKTSFASTRWHHVWRYGLNSISFVHVQLPCNRRYCRIGRKQCPSTIN